MSHLGNINVVDWKSKSQANTGGGVGGYRELLRPLVGDMIGRAEVEIPDYGSDDEYGARVAFSSLVKARNFFVSEMDSLHEMINHVGYACADDINAMIIASNDLNMKVVSDA